MEIDDPSVSSDEDELPVETELTFPHSSEIRVDIGDENSAKIICRTLDVDKGPSRSDCVKTLTHDGTVLIIQLKSGDVKSMQKSIANILEMLDLAKGTIDIASNKSWLDEPKVPATKRVKTG